MFKYIVQRVLISIPVLLGITVIVFLMAHMMPGDAVLAMITDNAPMSEEMIEIRRGQLGLNRPLPVQYLDWMSQLLRGNMGYSYITSEPIAETIANRIPATLELMGVSLIFSIIVGVILGIVSAMRQYSMLDYALTILGFAGVSIPVFFLGMVLIYVFALRLDIFPTSGMLTPGEPFTLADNLRHLVLPATALGVLRTAVFMRYTRASMLEALHSEYITTARAKGLREQVVIIRHGLRNALIPIITVIGLSLPVLFGGAVIIEQIFQWPGMGLLYIFSITQRDSPMVMGLALISAVIVLVSNLLTDIVYALVDPRIRYD